MIDLRKPLEGVPGLLLLAVLVLFGATIGVSLALVFSLVEMKDSLANFLGGVVGAGLGAALAVMGAVYVQRKEREMALSGPVNALRYGLFEAQLCIRWARTSASKGGLSGSRRARDLLQKASSLVSELPSAAPISEGLHRIVERAKDSTIIALAQAEGSLGPGPNADAEVVDACLDMSERDLDEIIEELEAIAPTNERH